MLLLLLGLFVALFFGSLLMSAVEWLKPGEDATKLMTCVVTLAFHGATLFLTHRFLREHQTTWGEAFGLNSPRVGRTLLLATLVGVMVLPMAWSLSQLSAKLMEAFHQQPEMQEAIQALRTTPPGWQRVYFALSAILTAPVVEEVLFRGILYPTIKQTGHPRIALWSTSLLFAASHFNVMTFIPLTFLALILTLLYETTNNLLAPITTHALFNAANFIVILMEMSGPS